VGEQLLLYVKELEPKPHLKVLESLSRPSGNDEYRISKRDLLRLLKTGIPIDHKLLLSIGRDPEFDIPAFAKLVRKDQKFWKRVFWHIPTLSYRDVRTFSDWLQESKSLLNQNLFNTSFEKLKADASFSHLNNGDIFHRLLIYANTMMESNNIPGVLASHLANWNQVRKLVWEYSFWSGSFVPFFLKGQAGILAMSIWHPKNAASRLPGRLSLLMALRNGWTFQSLFEYRETDLAGAIDVNNPECEKMANEQLASLVNSLRHKGFNHIGIRVNMVKNLEVDYTQLIPPVHHNEKYIG
jgi:hypothetical protein